MSERFWCATCEKVAEAGEHECPCQTCGGTGKADGTPDSPRCSDCYCDSCSEKGKKIVGLDGDDKPICKECVEAIERDRIVEPRSDSFVKP